MRLVRIKPIYFRGFGNSDWINLDADLVVLHGPNGFGKTSLTEAVEWLLYGKTKRRERGETLCQRDYQGSYRNAHAPAGSPTSVEAMLRSSTGVEFEVRRDLEVGPRNVESSQTFVNSSPASLTTIGLPTDEFFSPVIAQDSLQEFIHAKPKERRDKICAALGLDPLVRYKTAADKARTRFQSDPPQVVKLANGRLAMIVSAMSHSPRVQVVGARWARWQFDLDADTSELQRAILGFLTMQEWDEAVIIAGLGHHREDAARRVFDDGPIRVPIALTTELEKLNERRQQIAGRVASLTQAIREFQAAVASLYSRPQLQFWETGLGLVRPERPDMCPMCEADTLTQGRRTELGQRISQSANYTTATNALAQESALASQFIRGLASDVRAVFPHFLSHDQRDAILGLFQGNHELCNLFLTAHDSASVISQQTRELLLDRAQRVESIPTLAANAGTVHLATGVLLDLQELLDRACRDVAKAARDYADAFNAFRPRLQSKISSDAAIQEIDGLLAPLNGWRSVQIVSTYAHLLNESLDVVRQIEEQIQTKQAALLQTRGQEIRDWYDLLNPGAPVRYARMEPGTDSLSLWASTFGVEINAVACLSQCQLNCLGLSMHFMRLLTPGSPLAFVLMDDPVQSMDDDHSQAFVIEVIRQLIARNLQVIVFSHVQGLVDSIWETYYDRAPRSLRISNYQKTGPEIENAETLQQAITRAQALSGGNEDNRRLALDVIRRSVELLIREVCRTTHSTPPPYDATARQMLPFFGSCPGTIPGQLQGLRVTIEFSDPGPHTQVGWPVPTQPQITSHIDRIRQTARELGVMN